MKIIVNPHKLEIEKSPVNEKEINITKCEFEFNDIEQDLVKKAFFTLKDTTYEQIIVNGECDIPSEVLEEQGQIEIGVIAYQVEDEEYIKRYNPSPAYFTTWKGSLRDAENSSKPTPSQLEQIESEIAALQDDVSDLEENKQDTLVSGENIRTINNQDLLGSGDIDLNETYYTKNEVDSIKTTIEGEIPTKVSQLDNDSEFITKEVNNLTYYTLATNTGSTIELGINTSTYVMTLNLKNSAGTTISTQSIDLPLESVVVSGSYDSINKAIILTLQSGSTITIPVADLVSGLQSEITNDNKLSSDLVDDTGHTHKFVSSSDITNWNNKSDFSGSYNDLTNKPDLTIYEDKSNKVTTIGSSSTDTQYPSAKCMYDSQVSQDTQIQALQEENDYLNSIIDQLPKVTGEGKEITLNNTIEGKMSLELGSTELEQFTTTGKNLFNINETYTTFGCTASVSNNSLTQTNTNYYCRTAWLISNLTVGQTYTLKANFSNPNACSIELRILDSANDAQIETSGKDTSTSGSLTVTFIATETSHYIRIYSNTLSTTNTYSVTFSEIQLELGDSATSWEKYTGRNPAPNPDYPQQIHTISGDNEIVVQNKNLLKITSGTGYSFVNGIPYNTTSSIVVDNFDSNNITYHASTASYLEILTNVIQLKPNTEYTLSFDRTTTATNNQTFVYNYDNGTYSINYRDNNTNKYEITFTTSANGQIVLGFGYGNVTGTTTISNIQIELGSSKTTFVSHQEQVKHINLGSLEYCKIGNYKDEFMKPSGKNLYNGEVFSTGKRISTSTGGTYSATGYNVSIYVEVKPSTNYTLSSGIQSYFSWYDSSKQYISGDTWNNGTSKTSPNNAKYIRFDFQTGANVMFNEGSVAYPYEPYPDGKWYLKKNIGKVVLDGSEDEYWSVQYTGTSNYFYRYRYVSDRLTTSSTLYLSNYYKYTNIASTNEVEGINITNTNELRIRYGTEDTLDNYKLWLSTHNLIVYYVLATPTYTLLNDTLQDQINDIYYTMKSYKEQTNISQVNNDLGFTIKASALLDLNSLIG